MKIKAFQTELLNKNTELEQELEALRTENARIRADNRHSLVIAQLQADKAKMQQELSNIRAAVTGSTEIPSFQPTQVGAPIITIPDIYPKLLHYGRYLMNLCSQLISQLNRFIEKNQMLVKSLRFLRFKMMMVSLIFHHNGK